MKRIYKILLVVLILTGCDSDNNEDISWNTKWASVLEKHKTQQDDFKKIMEQLPRNKDLQQINTYINKTIEYRREADDIWSTVSDTLNRGWGDCEDYAIAKFFILKELGYKDLKITVLRNKRTDEIHAVISIHNGRYAYYLDNNTDDIDVSDEKYQPIYSITETYWTRH